MSARATIQANTESDWTVIRRLLALSWRYRAGCIKVFVYQIILLAIALSGLSLTGLGIDVIRNGLQPTAAPPRWPFHLSPPSTWSPMATISVIGLAILLLALLRALLNYLYSIARTSRLRSGGETSRSA